MSLAGTLLLIEASFCNSGCPCCAGTVEVPAGVPQALPSTPAPEQDPIQLLMLDMKAAELMQKVPGLQGPAARHLLKVSCLSSLDCCSKMCDRAAAQPCQCLRQCTHTGPTRQLLLGSSKMTHACMQASPHVLCTLFWPKAHPAASLHTGCPHDIAGCGCVSCHAALVTKLMFWVADPPVSAPVLSI